MNFTKKLCTYLSFIIIVCIFTGCQSNSVPKVEFPTKTVVQNTYSDYATFEFELPEDWISGPEYEMSVIAVSAKEYPDRNLDAIEALPYTVQISGYEEALNNSDNKEIYDDLFNGEGEKFRERLQKSVAKSRNTSLENDGSVKGWIDFLIPDDEENTDSGKEYVTDFKCTHYSGKYGKITEIQYCIDYDGVPYHMVECYREDIPYMAAGAIDENLELSSGEVALLTVDSLKVTKNK